MEHGYLKYVCLTYWKHIDLGEKLGETILFIDCKGIKEEQVRERNVTQKQLIH